VLPTSPVLITGTIPEEPVVTRVVTAGSGVWCGSVLPDADACGVAFRVAMDAHFASHSDELPCTPSAPATGLDSPPPTTSSQSCSRDIRQCCAATFGECPSHLATTWDGYFSTESVAHDARRFWRSHGHRVCATFPMIRVPA